MNHTECIHSIGSILVRWAEDGRRPDRGDWADDQHAAEAAGGREGDLHRAVPLGGDPDAADDPHAGGRRGQQAQPSHHRAQPPQPGGMHDIYTYGLLNFVWRGGFTEPFQNLNQSNLVT